MYPTGAKSYRSEYLSREPANSAWSRRSSWFWSLELGLVAPSVGQRSEIVINRRLVEFLIVHATLPFGGKRYRHSLRPASHACVRTPVVEQLVHWCSQHHLSTNFQQNTMLNESFIVAAARTPIGSLSGTLSTVPAPQLGAAACIRSVLQRAGVAAGDVDEVIMGNVVSGGVGQNPARQAAIAADVPTSVGATTVSKVCGSGLKAVMLADQAIRLGDSQIVIAGGMENMSLAPYLLPKARSGYRMGHGQVVDSMIHDGLWDAYGSQHMGVFGDQCASEYQFTRECRTSTPSAAISGLSRQHPTGYLPMKLCQSRFPVGKARRLSMPTKSRVDSTKKSFVPCALHSVPKEP